MSDDATTCPKCGEPTARPAAASVSNNLVLAIIGTLFCWPFGILSIIYATRVNTKLAAGDLVGAMEASRFARMWAGISVGGGLLATFFWIVQIADVGNFR